MGNNKFVSVQNYLKNGKVDRPLKKAVANKTKKSLFNINKLAKQLITMIREDSAQDPSEVKTSKRKSLTPMVSEAYKKAQKTKKARTVSNKDLDRGKLSEKVKSRRYAKARGMTR